MLADSEGWAEHERELVSLQHATLERVTALEVELAALTQTASRQREEVVHHPQLPVLLATLTLTPAQTETLVRL